MIFIDADMADPVLAVLALAAAVASNTGLVVVLEVWAVVVEVSWS